VDGERSFPGALRFTCRSLDGETLADFTVQARGDQLVVLGGTLPELIYE